MKMNSLQEYIPPIIRVYTIEMEACITATSITRISSEIEEEWIEEEITFDKITW